LQLRAAEEQIILRSRAVEMRWSSDKCQQSVKGMCNFFLSVSLPYTVTAEYSAECVNYGTCWYSVQFQTD